MYMLVLNFPKEKIHGKNLYIKAKTTFQFLGQSCPLGRYPTDISKKR